MSAINEDLKFSREMNKQQTLNNIKEVPPMSTVTKSDIEEHVNKKELKTSAETGTVIIEGTYQKSYNTAGVQKLLRKQFILGTLTTLAVMTIVVLITVIAFMQREINTLNNILDKSVGITEQYKQTAIEQESIISKTNDELNLVISLNKELSDTNRELSDNLVILQNRQYLFDEYDYALLTYNGLRTDLTYNELESLIAFSKEKNIDPHLPLTISKVESNCTRTAASTKSTARGYTQFLHSTANNVYTKMLGRSKYTHDMAFDGVLNFEMCVTYLDYLLKNSNGDVRQALMNYNGGELKEEYYYKIETILVNNTHTNLNKIQQEYKRNM